MSSRGAHAGVLQVAASLAAALVLSSCGRNEAVSAEKAIPAEPAGEFAWARSALERNPRLELLASDSTAGVFTVRDKATGEVHAVKLNEIAAAPLVQLEAALRVQPSEGQAGAARGVDDRQALREAAAPARSAQPQEPGQERGDRAAPSGQAGGSSQPNYTIERTDGQLRVSGPGVSIVSAEDAADVRERAAQRNDEPIICEGRRMVHLDSRTLHVDGDAVTVRDGCELFITNSRIVASGVGVIVRDGAVHISNSHIEGAENSVDLDSSSRIFVRSSTFQGVARRDQLAMVQDQGGNRWR